MQQLNIGVLDSGIGGLTVLDALIQTNPNTNFHYVGDTARVPYGSKSPSNIRAYVREIVDDLNTAFKLDGLVIACNSATAAFGERLNELASCPVFGVINPGAASAIIHTENQRVALIGTSTTIRSEAYQEALKTLNPHIQVWTQACPLFVPLIEEGLEDHELTAQAIQHYLGHLPPEFSTCILGCTHYPIIKDRLKAAFPDVYFVDSAEAVANEVYDFFSTRYSAQQDIDKTSDRSQHSLRFTDPFAYGHRWVKDMIEKHRLIVRPA